MNKIVTLIDKEWADAFRNRYVLFIVFLLPAVMVVIPVLMLGLSNDPNLTESLNFNQLPPAILERPPYNTLDVNAATQAFFGQQFSLLFLIVPLAIPMTIASYSIVGEKREHSLEPLLATPISTAQLLAAKSLAAAAPGVLAAWAGALLYALAVQVVVPNPDVRAILLAAPFLVVVFVLSPLLTILATTLGLIISSRVNDPRVAEQLGMIVVVPILGLILAQVAGVLTFDVTLALIVAIILVILDFALLQAAVRVFNRETILTRWK